MKKINLLIAFIICSIIHVKAFPLEPDRLTCEYIGNPLGIDTKAPRLSWTLKSSERNQSQSAYEIIVNDNEKEIGQGKGNQWSTGKILSSQNIQIEYQGKPLKPFTRYYWSVKVYDQNGQSSSWSEIKWFETAMLDAADWSAKWISDGSRNPEKDEDYYKEDRMPLLRKSFDNKENSCCPVIH